ncbi:hypothetical protein SK803_29370 [Lentzea sp. BCCO 10_0856]|uniref:Syndecan 1 n=1 Tax=Lentzea miocenica TaxID=3095431 RepID=A0ABU4T8S3_9PSEU|nr:hypothetical protein [Lentzea sp. BCCO 10_0856]MDX8034347.1 hypothetical protein [Lentzea sp. BCCO 10_0856]
MWPFRRRSAPLPVVRADWRTLPPLQRIVTAHPLINPVSAFSSRLASWQNPSFLAPLAHVVGPAEPSGSIADVAAPAPESYGWKSELGRAPAADGPVVARIAEAPPVVSAGSVGSVVSRSVVEPEPDLAPLEAPVAPPASAPANAPDVVPASGPALVQRSVSEDLPLPAPAPATRPRRLGLGEPISPVLQRTAETAALTGPAGPDTSQPSGPAQPASTGDAVDSPSAPIAGFADHQRSTDASREVAQQAAPPMAQRAIELPVPTAHTADVRQSNIVDSSAVAADHVSGVHQGGSPTIREASPPTVQRLVGATPSLPVVARLEDSAAPETSAVASSGDGQLGADPSTTMPTDPPRADPGTAVPSGQVGTDVSAAPPTKPDTSGPVTQRLVGNEPTLPVVGRADSAAPSAGRESAAPSPLAAAGSDFTEPVAQRLVGGEPSLPVVAPSAARESAAPGPRAAAGADFTEPVVQRLVGGEPSLPVVAPSAARESAAPSPSAAAGADIAEPVAQRLVGSEPSLPVIGRTESADIPSTPQESAGPLAVSRADFVEPVAQRVVGGEPSLPVIARTDSATAASTPQVATALSQPAPDLPSATTLTLTRAHFTEPVAQRLVGSAPPIIQRTADVDSPTHRESPPNRASTQTGEPAVIQRTDTTPQALRASSGSQAPGPLAPGVLTLAHPAALQRTTAHSAAALPTPALPTPAQPAAALPVVTLPTPDPAPVLLRTPDPAPSPPPAEPVQRTAEVQRAEAPQPQASAQNPEELLRKLYDPLLRRLKADLWLDRERRGALTDL